MSVHSVATGLRPLQRLRARLTAWYVATFCGMLLLLGGGLFLIIRHQLAQQTSASLVDATRDLMNAALIRERESGHSAVVVDALDELHVVGRQLYLFDTTGRPLKPPTAPAWISALARDAGARGVLDAAHEDPREDGQATRVHAQRFRLASGQPMVAVATMDDVEFEDRYGDLIAAFSAAAFAAAICVAFGAWILVRQSTRPIERSVTRMRQFMADAAHELRTPLTILRSRAEVSMQQPRSAEDYVSALRSIEREATRLGGIVDDLLLLARAESGELPLRRERVYLDDIALDATHAALPLAQRNSITLAVPTFEETPIVADGALVRQLIMILVDNALKFTPSGGNVSVTITRVDGSAVLSVTDSGPGIPPEQLSQVFDRFYRGDEARGRSSGGGAGLGLSIARWIAEQHGATINIESAPGAGTSVRVRFPLSAPADGAPRDTSGVKADTKLSRE